MRQDRWGCRLAALVGAIWCSLYTWPLLNPFTVDVVFRDDWAQHTLGWLFFRNQRFAAFPLGQLRNFLHPLGSTVGYMDSIPMVALALRPFSAILPTDFQYLGLWIVASSAALAYFAARIASHVTPFQEQQALVGVLTAMAPTLISRIVHPALCGHWLIMAAFALSLVAPESPAAAWRALRRTFALLAVASATHPYFAVMVLAIVIGLPVRLRAQLGWRALLAVMIGMPVTAVSILALLGYIGGGMQDSLDGFGMYSANLNTFWNSMGHSRLFAGLPNTHYQYEGYCYLGAGVFLMAAVALALSPWPGPRARMLELPWRSALWPACAAFACAVYAVASPVRWGDQELFSVAAYQPFDHVLQIFRSTGRFIWPLGYVIVLALSLSAVRAMRERRLWATGTLLVAVALQGYDLDPSEALHRFDGARERVLSAPEWALADGLFKHLVLYPAEIMNSCDGPKGYRARIVTELAYLAYRHHWTFNSGYAARVRPGTSRYCAELKETVGAGQLQPNDIYIVWRQQLHIMRAAGATCGRLDKVLVCVQASDRALANYLSEHP